MPLSRSRPGVREPYLGQGATLVLAAGTAIRTHHTLSSPQQLVVRDVHVVSAAISSHLGPDEIGANIASVVIDLPATAAPAQASQPASKSSASSIRALSWPSSLPTWTWPSRTVSSRE